MSSKGCGQNRLKNKRGFYLSFTFFQIVPQPLNENYAFSGTASDPPPKNWTKIWGEGQFSLNMRREISSI